MSKAVVARESALRINPAVKIVAHHANIKATEYGPEFFKTFQLVRASDGLIRSIHIGVAPGPHRRHTRSASALHPDHIRDHIRAAPGPHRRHTRSALAPHPVHTRSTSASHHAHIGASLGARFTSAPDSAEAVSMDGLPRSHARRSLSIDRS